MHGTKHIHTPVVLSFVALLVGLGDIVTFFFLFPCAPQKAAAPADGDAMDDSSEGEGGGDKSSPPSPLASSSPRELVTVTPYKLPNPGPYPQVRRMTQE